MTIDQPSHPSFRLSGLTWLLLLAAMGSLVVGLVIPGTSYVLLCASIAFSGAALLSRAAGRRREDGETDVDRNVRPRATGMPLDPALEADERWDRVLAASRGSGEEQRSAGGGTTLTATPAELRDVAAEVAAQVRAELDAVRSELRQSERDRDGALLRRIEELASTSGGLPERLEASLTAVHETVNDLKNGLDSALESDVEGPVPSTAADEQLEAAIAHLTAVAGSVGTLAEVEVVIETSMRDLRSAISSLSERVEGIPVALRAELGDSLASVQTRVSQLRESIEPKVDHLLVQAEAEPAAHGELSAQLAVSLGRVQAGVSHLRESIEPKVAHLLVQAESRAAADGDLGAQVSELHRALEGLGTLEGSARELRTALASVSDQVRSIEAAVQTSSEQQASLGRT